MRTLRRSAGALTICSSPQLRPCTAATPGSVRKASRSVSRIPVCRRANAPFASERGPRSSMKKLRDSPMAMRSSYTSVFIADASEVIETTDAAPNTIPDSVKSDRSLCARISRSASTISSSQSRIAQRLDGREPRRTQRGEQPGHEPHAHRGPQRNRRNEGADDGGHLHDVSDDAGQRGPQPQPQQPADDRDDENLGEYVGEDATRGGAERHASAEFAHSLDDRREQDVRDDNTARDERDDPDDQENEVEEQQELTRLLARSLPRTANIEILDTVARIEQAAHLRLGGAAADRGPCLECQKIEMVVGAVLRDGGRNRNVGALIPILEGVVLPGGEVELFALEHAHDAITLVVETHVFSERLARATEERIGVLPAEHRHPRLMQHIQIAE